MAQLRLICELGHLNPPIGFLTTLSSFEIPFSFCKHTTVNIPCSIFSIHLDPYTPRSPPSDHRGYVPFVAYVERRALEHYRSQSFYKKHQLTPGAVVKKMYKKLVPTDPLHDPLFVGILLAVAQAQRRQLYPCKVETAKVQNSTYIAHGYLVFCLLILYYPVPTTSPSH